MRSEESRGGVPEVNLLAKPPRAFRLPRSGRATEAALIAAALLLWALVGVAIAMLLGWHPSLGPGP